MTGGMIVVRTLAALALAGAAAAAPAMQPASWAQARSDIPAAKNVLFGTLPNGMRYAILRNGVPAGRVSIRLRIDAGSLDEKDTQQGLAHFLEHMAFRGSTHVASGEAFRILERLGLSVGADANAATDFTQTVYKFDIPSADDAKLDTGLMLMRETASELTLSDAAFEAERPVILSEERARAGSDFDRSLAELDLLFPGQPAAARMPVGKADLLRTTGPQPLRQFYRDFYRPERAALIVVGDIDPAHVEAQIKAHFADWKNPAPAVPDPAYGTPAVRGTTIRVMAAPGLNPQLALMWLRPYDDGRRDKARLHRLIVQQLAMNILSRRLYGLAASDNSPFAAASAGTANRIRSGMITTLGALIKPDQWQRALQTLIVAKRQITAPSGVSQADLDTAIASFRSLFQTRAAGLSTRASNTLADELVATVNEDDVFTSDADDLPMFEEIARTVTPDEVAAAARTAFSGSGPLIFLTGATAIASEAEIGKALADAETVSTSAIQVSAKAWPFTHFGTPGKIVERHRIDDLDVTALRFANGVRLNVKHTDLVKDQVLIAVRFGTGRQALARDKPSLDWTISGWLAGGLSGLGLAEQQQIFAGRIHGEAASISDDAFALSSATRPEDFDLQMQLLTAYMTAPAWRGDAFDRVRSVLAGMLPKYDTSPAGVMRRDVAQLLHSGDRRWAPPAPADLAGIHVEDARRLLEPQIASGPIEITIVGDVDADRAIAMTAATFGTLPPRRDRAPLADHAVFPRPAPDPVTLHHNGRADQGLAFVAWPIPDLYSDPQRTRTLDLLARIVSQRLFDQVRVAQGATYTTAASANASDVYPGYGYLAAFAETPPDKVQSFYATLDGIVADLKAHDASADEIARARTPVLEQLATSRRTNAYWASRLSGSQADPRKIDLIRTVEESFRRIGPADLRRAAQEYLDPARIWRLRILPNAAPPATVK